MQAAEVLTSKSSVCLLAAYHTQVQNKQTSHVAFGSEAHAQGHFYSWYMIPRNGHLSPDYRWEFY